MKPKRSLDLTRAPLLEPPSAEAGTRPLSQAATSLGPAHGGRTSSPRTVQGVGVPWAPVEHQVADFVANSGESVLME